jgi:hypothetical protein
MARYYILSRNQVGEPFVLAETPDKTWAKDESRLLPQYVVLSEEEAMLDPDWAPAVDRWRAKDDTAVEDDEAILQEL